MTPSKKFKSIRTDKKLSMDDVAAPCKTTRQTVWKLEQGQLPGGKMFKALCIKGLHLSESSQEWQELQALWLASKTGQPINTQELTGRISRHFIKSNAEMEQFLKKASKLSPETWEHLQKAMDRPAVLAGLAALNTAFEAGKR